MRNLPVPLKRDELVEILEDILQGVKSGDTMEGSIEFLLPDLKRCEHCGGSGQLAVIGVDPGVPEPATVTGEAPCPMCNGKGYQEPEGDLDVRANYRIGNLMGQGGMRIIGRMGNGENDKALRFVAQELRRLAPNAATPDGGTSHDGRRAFQLAAHLLETPGRWG